MAKVFIAATEDAVANLGRNKAANAPTKAKSFDPLEINAKRMRAGTEVGEAYLWGLQAVELLERKLVHQDTIDQYRAAFLSKHKDHYGGTVAERFKYEAKARHEAAQEEYRARKNDACVKAPAS